MTVRSHFLKVIRRIIAVPFPAAVGLRANVLSNDITITSLRSDCDNIRNKFSMFLVK